MTWWDSYQSAVHKNAELSDIDKFTYLKSLVQRSGLTLTSANYHEAISILEKRFSNKQMIIAEHMDLLLNVEPVLSQNNLLALRRLYDKSGVPRTWTEGITPDSYGSPLSSALVKKLPQELRLTVSRKFSDDVWNMDELKARERTTAGTREGTGRRGKEPSMAATLMWTKEYPSQKLLLFSVPLICQPLANMPNRLCIENYEHLHQLDFADSLEDVGQGEPDILIGSDYYWQLITGEVICGNGGPIAVCTRLGWDLSGPVSFKEECSACLVTHVLRVHEKFGNITFTNGRYKVRLS